MKRWTALALVLLLLPLTACRTRTSVSGSGTGRDSEGRTSGSEIALSQQTAGEDGSRPTVMPDAERRTWDDSAAAEITDGASHRIGEEGSGEEPGPVSPEADTSAALLGNEGRTATLTVPAEEADRTGTDDQADPADSVYAYYTALLQERTASLFECRRGNVYLELAQPLTTVYRTSAEHQLILDCGAYDVASRLTEERLAVDAGWVVRKNPDAIVKLTDSTVLGSGVDQTGRAEALYRQLLAREGWEQLAAVRDGRVLLLSQEMLDSQPLRLAAMLYIARAAAPDAFADVDPAQALTALLEEAGADTGACYVYQP